MSSEAVTELLGMAAELPYGAARVAALEEATRAADALGNVELGYEVREQLTDAAVMSGRADLLITHFSWCLAQFDRNPESFNEYDLLWRYKWVMGNLTEFPEIPLSQIERLIDDMAERFHRYGATGRTVAGYRLLLAMHLGNRPEAAEAFAIFHQGQRDMLSNCAACEANMIVGYWAFADENTKALEAAKNILAGKLSCRTVPMNTHARLLIPLLKLQRPELAADSHRAGYRLVSSSADAVWPASEHLKFLGLTGNFTKGVQVLTKFLPKAFHGYEPANQFTFYLGAWLLLDAMAQAGLNSKIRLPGEHPLAAGTTSCTAEQLRNWCHAEAHQLARRFDTRNGTAAFQETVTKTPELHAFAVDHPLT